MGPFGVTPKPFRMESHFEIWGYFERKHHSDMKAVRKATIWSFGWLQSKWWKTVPNLLRIFRQEGLLAKLPESFPNKLFQKPLPRGLPIIFQQPLPMGHPGFFKQPFRGYEAFQASFTNPCFFKQPFRRCGSSVCFRLEHLGSLACEIMRNGNKTIHLKQLGGLGSEMVQNGTKTDHLNHLGELEPEMLQNGTKTTIWNIWWFQN